MTEIKYVTAQDKSFWYTLDKHLPESRFENKVRDKMGYKDCGGFTIVLFSDDLIEIAKEMYGEFYGN